MPARKRKRRRGKNYYHTAIAVFLIFAVIGTLKIISLFTDLPASSTEAANNPTAYDSSINAKNYPEELVALYNRNPETIDFIKAYPDRESLGTQEIDLSGDYTPGTVPFLLQWDTRWGYNYYGDELIALAGCGPVCLSMAYIYFTSDTSMNPRQMCEYVYNEGYYSDEGTKWSLWTEGVQKLGLTGKELALDENIMKRQLDNGSLIICSMAPGDFTTTGHIILIRGYDKNGFYINDPNSRENSSRQWSYTRLSTQIKGMWVISD